jgi:hypothetical protein
MAATVYELKWLNGILIDLGVSHTQPMCLRGDSQFALHIAKNLVFRIGEGRNGGSNGGCGVLVGVGVRLKFIINRLDL